MDVGSARGGRRPAEPLLCEIVRSLGEADLPLLRNPPSQGSRAPTVQKLSHSHHALARELAKGTVSDAEAGLIAGYSLSRISILRGDPAFRELLVHYETQRELVFVDVLERMRLLGMNSVEELQDRLENKPEEFSARELMELTELMLVKGRAGPGSRQAVGGAGNGAPQGPVTVQVNFVSADHRPLVDGVVVRERQEIEQ